MELKKNPKADLENRRGLYLEIGLVVIMAVALAAFEWKSYDQEQVEVVPTFRNRHPLLLLRLPR